MVQGINTNVEYRGEIYHIQTEDCGPRRPMIKSLVFDKGGVVTVVETSYAELALSPGFTEKEVARRLTIQHWKIAADLQRGALCLNGEEPAEAQVERRTGVDRRSDKKPSVEDTVRARPAESDRRVTMLAMVLAVVSVMLGFLAIRGLPSLSNPDAVPRTTTPLLVSEHVAPLKKPPVAQPPAEARLADMRHDDDDDAPPAAPEPREATIRPQPRQVSSPPATPVRPPAPSHDSVNGNSAPAMPAVMRSATRPSVPEPPILNDSDETRSVPAEPRPPSVEPEPLPEPTPPVAPGDLVELAEVDVPPLPTSREMPSYTKRAKRKKQQGTVEMLLLINERGAVSDLRLKRTIPESDLNDVAINSVRRWRFDPAREGDVAVRVWKPVSIIYTIESGQTRVDLLE